ncbi:MAG: peptidase [Thermoleophilia bacterium]|nr:peptidase [Thermoleophilia bacterium]
MQLGHTYPSVPSDFEWRVPPFRGGQDGLPVVRTYDASVPARWWPTRISGDAATGDQVLDTAQDNVLTGLKFFRDVLGRDSIDGAHNGVHVSAHDETIPLNAAWTGESMIFSDGGGADLVGADIFKPFANALDVTVHEMAHGITDHSAALVYEDQSGALNESMSDVFGEAAEQWHEHPETFGTVAGAKQGDWLIGEDISTPAFGKAMRDFAHPGTAYDNEFAGVDPQPGHMRDFVDTLEDAGGVHINSGIPNRAAYEVAQQLGTEKLAKVWYDALTTRLHAGADFSDAATATIASAKALYDDTAGQAVSDAWASVGVLPKQPDAAAE